MDKDLVAFGKDLIWQHQHSQVLALNVKDHFLGGNLKQEVFIQQSDVLTWSRLMLYRHTIWLEREDFTRWPGFYEVLKG